MIDPYTLPDDLPAPTDDGAADHLTGMSLPAIELEATDGRRVALAEPVGARSSTPTPGPAGPASRCWRTTGT